MASTLPGVRPNYTKQANNQPSSLQPHQEEKVVANNNEPKHPKHQEYATLEMANRLAYALQDIKKDMAQEMASIVRYERDIDPALLTRFEKIQNQLSEIVNDLNNDF